MKSARALWLISYLAAVPAVANAAPAATPQAAPTASSQAAPATNSPATPAATPPAAPAASAAANDRKKVDLKADRLSVDVKAEKYQAEGDVRVTQDGASLLADSVTYNRLTGDALAKGNVFLEKAGDTLKGDWLSLNLRSKTGEIANGKLFVKKPNFHVGGASMQKTGEDDYLIKRGTFTTCDGEKPSWHFEARDVDVTLEEYATARDAVFYAGDIPLMYTPYLVFPVKRERQTGFLIPKFGRSTKKGFFIDQPYYWAINPSQDATFTLDVESSRGAGLGVDYRYMRARGSEGQMQLFGIYDTKANAFRGELNQKHLELLSPATTLSSDIHLITDRSYYRDFGDITGEYNRQLLESNVSFAHRWDRYGVTADVRYAEDLIAPNNDTTLQRLPAISFIGAGDKIGPGFFSLDSSFTNFQRTQGENGQRVELHPRYTLYKEIAGLDLSGFAGYRQRLYNAYGDDAPTGVREIGQADAGATVSLPLERIYNGTLRHLLIPSFDYGYVQVRNDNAYPFFDYGDRILGQSIASWSITNVFTEKVTPAQGPAEYRDLLYVKLGQGYQFSGKRRDLLTLVDEGHHLTDLMLDSRYMPEKWITVSADARYNPIDSNLSTGNVAVEVKGEGNNQGSMGYRYSRHEVDYLEARFGFPILKQLSGTVLARYSFDKGGFLESRYALEYKQQCWSVIAAYADRPGSVLIPANRQFTINFTLAGIGALGPVRAF